MADELVASFKEKLTICGSFHFSFLASKMLSCSKRIVLLTFACSARSPKVITLCFQFVWASEDVLNHGACPTLKENLNGKPKPCRAKNSEPVEPLGGGGKTL